MRGRNDERHVRARRSGGFTLVELMLTVTMLSIVMYLTMESVNRQQKTSIVTDQVVEVQNNVRAVAALIEREARMAGFMVPDAAGACGADNTTAPDELWISEIEMIVPDDERAGDLGARLASSQPWNNADGTYNMDSTTMDLDEDGVFFYDNDGNGTNEADFRVGGGFIVADMANPARGVGCGVVLSVNASQLQLDLQQGQLATFVSSSMAPQEIVIVPAAHYSINTTGGTTELLRNGDLLAKGVEDFQVSWFFDVDDDGVIDPGDERGITAATQYDPASIIHTNDVLKEIRYSIVVRTRATDVDFSGGAFLNFENRVAVVGNDNFRRRVIAGRVRPRNMGQTGSI